MLLATSCATHASTEEPPAQPPRPPDVASDPERAVPAPDAAQPEDRADADLPAEHEPPPWPPSPQEPVETLPRDCRVIDADVLGGSGCAVTAAGRVYCWGDNAMRQLGTEHAPDLCAATVAGEALMLPCSLRPIRVAGVDTAVDVAVAPGRACALREDGQVLCWGSNHARLLGTDVSDACDNPYATEPSHPGHVPCSALPVEVEGIEHATQIAAWGHTCALEAGGQVKCWGYNYATATAVPGIERARKVTGSCALLADGEVRCWGPNDSGTLGTTLQVGACAGPYNAPCSVAALPVATGRASSDVSSGWQHACAVASDGTLACWGHNGYGQLGRPAGDSPVCASGFPCEMLPRVVPNLAGVTGVFAGIGSTCARTSRGRALCWGNLPDSQLASAAAHEPREIALPAGLRSVANERGSLCFVLEDGGLHCLGMHYVDTGGVGVLTFDPSLRQICGAQAAGSPG